jgi:hypothetical protein
MILLSGGWPIQGKVCCWEVVSVPCHEDVISFVFPGIQGDCKVTAKRMT